MAGRRLGRVVVVALVMAGCGSERDDEIKVGQSSEAIISGTPASQGSLPGIGVFLVLMSNAAELCTATLISDRLLLTAAHCVADLPAERTIGFYAGTDIKVQGAIKQMLSVSEVTAHPGYVSRPNPPSAMTDFFDIAVARLAQPTTIPPVRIVRPQEVKTLLKVGASMLIVGYGQTSATNGNSIGVKYQGTTQLAAVGHSEIMTARPPAAQTCDGDSGGPALGGPDGAPRILGVTSRGAMNCDEGSLSTRVDAYLTWLHSFGPIPCGSGLSADCPGGDEQPISETTEASDEGCSVGASRAPTPGAGAVLIGLALLVAAAATRRRR